MSFAVGETVDRYELLEKLGEGGMGVVFRARDTRLGREVALKFLPASLVSDEVHRQRMIREARAAAALSHPSICAVYELGDADGQPYIAMAIAEGRDLQSVLRSGSIDVKEAIRMVMDVGRGIAVAHAKGVIHRDIKPANVMLRDDGQVMILDFGLARTADASSLTSSGMYIGTMMYMSPEQLTGEAVDQRTDIWALGVMLYELLTGVLPFKATSSASMLYAVLSGAPEPVTALRAHVPLGIEWILNKAMAKKAQDRYQRVEAMCADLDALLEERVVGEWELERETVATTPTRNAVVERRDLPLKLLVVDDEPDLELLMRQHFRKRIRAGELDLTFAGDGKEALAKLAADPELDLVLTDIRMPVMDGLELLDALGGLDRVVKAIVISAYGDFGNIRAAMNRGAFDFLTKPMDFSDLDATIAKTALELSHFRDLRETRRRLSAMEQEMDVARRIQSAVVPRSLPSPPWLDRYAFVSPARAVGGDFHDLFELSPSSVGIAIGEVFGSGVGAAVFAAVTRTLLKALATRGDEPAMLLSSVGALLRAEGLNAMSTTALVGILDRTSGRFRFCSAGHPHPYVIRKSGEVTLLPGAVSPTLGARDAGEYQPREVTLEAGDILFCYSDGIPDAADADRRIFSGERLAEVLRTAAGGTAAEVVRTVVRAMEAFVGDEPQSDDVTAFAFRLLDA
jgi:phosphoserine phosphatase RsbU/P